jgi:hypothetical protein
MRNKVAIAALAAVISASAITATPAAAGGRDYYTDSSGYTYDSDGNRYYNGERVYRGRNEYYRGHCSGGNGVVGTVGGGAGGALIGNALGGTAGLVLGGVGGALLGRHLDKENTRDKHGC